MVVLYHLISVLSTLCLPPHSFMLLHPGPAEGTSGTPEALGPGWRALRVEEVLDGVTKHLSACDAVCLA